MQRDILHVNVTAFPIGVERAVNPSVRDRPVVVAVPNMPRAVAMAVSREAYLEGVMKGMPISVAKKFCRGLVVVPPNEPLYRRAGRALFEFASSFSPLVEPWRAGHIYIDVTGTRKLFGSPPDAGARIQREIRNRFRLRNTVGLASNKLVSRVASRVVRPRGLCDVFPGGEATFLSPLDVDVLPGVGDKTSATLRDLNVRIVGELAAIGPDHLFMAFGKPGLDMSRAARGVDESPVRPPDRVPVVMEEETLVEDSNDDRKILGALYTLVERGSRRLRAMPRLAGAIKVEIIHSDHVSASKEEILPTPSNIESVVFDRARALLEKTWTRRTRLRYLCVTLKNLEPIDGPRQLGLFEAVAKAGSRDVEARDKSLATALDSIRARYGDSAVKRGRTL